MHFKSNQSDIEITSWCSKGNRTDGSHGGINSFSKPIFLTDPQFNTQYHISSHPRRHHMWISVCQCIVGGKVSSHSYWSWFSSFHSIELLEKYSLMIPINKQLTTIIQQTKLITQSQIFKNRIHKNKTKQ